MQTRSRKNVLQQTEQNPRAKIKKGSKTPEVNESLRKIPVSPILGSRKRQQATQATEQAIKSKRTSLQSKLKTVVFGSRKSQQVVKISSSTSQSKLATPVLGSRKSQQAVKSNSSTSQSKPETPVFGSRNRQHAIQSTEQDVKNSSSPSESNSEIPVLGSKKRQQTVKSNSSSSQSKSETPVLGSRTRLQSIQVTDRAVKSSSSSSSQSNPKIPALGGRKRRHAIQVTEQNVKTSSSQSKHETPVLGSNKRRLAIQVAEQDVKSSSSSSQSKSNTKDRLRKGSKTLESKSKTPVWRKNTSSAFPLFDFKTKRQSTRISLNKSKDIYEFPCEDNKENVIKKKRKPQVRRKKLKPKPILKTMLTTDPHFEPTIPNSITTSTFYAKKKDKVPSNIRPRDMCSEIELADHSEVFSHCGDDIGADDAGYEASISVANDTEGTGLYLANTALSVFTTPKTNLYPGTSSTPLLHHEIRCANNAESSCASLANPGLSILPTPKTTLRYPGTSSTPFNHDDRYDFNPFIKIGEAVPITHKEEVKLCFGFDDSEDLDIGISPVKKNKQLTILHQVSMASFSNVEEIDPVPTRFTSAPARSQVTNFKRPIGIKNTQQNVKKKRFTSTKENKKKVENKSSDIEHKHSKNDCDKSVLFDEELAEFNTEMDKLKSPSKNILNFSPKNVLKNIAGNSFSNSPEKSFTAPARKSYDRKSLESVRQNFLNEFAGGYPTTDTDTENEDFRPPGRITKRKRKIVKTKANKSDGKPNIPQKTYPKKRGKINKENCTPPSVSSSKKQVRKNGTKNPDKTVTDWASDINSHFSEIEDMDLVIE